jgi:ATP-dependent Clp protease ATP-binding subunit ClpA
LDDPGCLNALRQSKQAKWTVLVADGLDAVVGRLAESLTGRRPRSVLLVGPVGVGKSAAVRELVRRRFQFGLGETPFWSTSGSRLIAGKSGYGMWQERCRDLVREAGCSRTACPRSECGSSTPNRTASTS